MEDRVNGKRLEITHDGGTFVRIYDEYISRQYGLWRPYVQNVIYRYLDFGDPHNGFVQ